MKKHISILEDDNDLRQLYTYILEDEDYELRTFPTVTNFMEHLNEVPDLFLLDVMLPDGDGIVLCQELKANPKTAHVPIIMVSAHKDLAEVSERCPGAEFIPKPFDINLLTKTIARKIG